MEKPTKIDRKLLKKCFKEIYPNYDPEKLKVVSRESAAKIVSECMNKCGKDYTPLQAEKILEKFDSENKQQNAKNEVKKTLMVAACAEELTEKKIMKMKKKWQKKQDKKKKASKEQKLKRKALKKKFKAAVKELKKGLKTEGKSWISFEEAEAVTVKLMEQLEMQTDKEQLAEIFAKLDNPKKEALTLKEVKLACKQLMGRREIDYEKAHEDREKWMKKLEKKELKQKKKQEKLLAKKNKEAATS